MPEQIPKLLLTRDEAAQSLSLCTRTVDAMVARGELHAVRVGRKVLLPLAELQRWISEQIATEAPQPRLAM